MSSRTIGVQVRGWQADNVHTPSPHVPLLSPQHTTFLIQIRVNSVIHFVPITDLENPFSGTEVIEPMDSKFFALDSSFVTGPDAYLEIHRMLFAVSITVNIQVKLIPFIRNLLAFITIQEDNIGESVLSVVFEINFLELEIFNDLEEFIDNILEESSIDALNLTLFTGHGTDSDCSICLEEFVVGQEVARTPCNHLFHGDCIFQWLGVSDACPICRFVLSSERE